MSLQDATEGSAMVARVKRAAAREGVYFQEGCRIVWTACLGWVAIRTARFILG